MRLLTDFARLIGRAQQPQAPAQPDDGFPLYPLEPVTPQESATRPTQCIKDHQQLKLHKVIDLAG